VQLKKKLAVDFCIFVIDPNNLDIGFTPSSLQ